VAKGKSKKRRSPAQVAAQKKATRAAKRARKGKTHTKTPRKAARKATRKAARKAPRRHRRKARIIHAYKTKKGKRVKTHASHETPRRRRRRRSRRHAATETPKRRRKSRRSRRRRKNPIMETPRRHRKRRTHRRRSNPRKHRRHTTHRRRNPLSGGKDFMAGVFGLVVGGLLTTGALRFAATHALTGSAGAYQDTPAAGQIYNAESPNAPLWSSWKTVLAAGASVVVPFGIASFVKKPGMKTFWQLAGFGSLAVVGVKLATDGLAKLTGKTMWGERLLAPEIMAQRDLATGVTPPAMAAATLAGLPAKQTSVVKQIGNVPTQQPAMQATQPATTAVPTAHAPAAPPAATPTPAPTHNETNHRNERPFNWATDGLGENSNVDN
jgi:hypothetical protein